MAKVTQGTKTYESAIDPRTNKPFSLGTTSIDIPMGVATPYAPINTSNPIPVDNLSTTPLNIPPPVAGTPAANNLSVVANQAANSATPPAPTTPTDTAAPNRNDLLTEALKGIRELGTQGDYTASAENEYQVAAKREALNKANADITTTTASYNQKIQQLKENPMGRTTDALAADIQNLETQRDERVANLNITKSVALGDYNTANDNVKAKVAAKFEPLDAQIKNLLSVYSATANDMTEKEKFQAQETIKKLDEKKKTLSTAYEAVLKTAAGNGAPASVLSAIDEAASREGATSADLYKAAGQYASEGEKGTLTDMPDGSRALVDTRTGEIIKSYGGGKSGGNNSDAIQRYAEVLASGGTVSPTDLKAEGISYSQVAQAAKEMPKPDGQFVSRSTGIAPKNMNDTQIAANSALLDLTKKIGQAQEIFSSLQSKGQTGLASGVLGGIFPTTERVQYNTLRGEIVDLIARARTGAAISSHEEKMYLDKVPSVFNKSLLIGEGGTTKLEGLKKSIEDKLNTNLDSYGVAVTGYSKVKVGDQEYTVGQPVTNNEGQTGIVLPDGTISVQGGGNTVSSIEIPQNTLAFANNNPGNLRFAGQEGAEKGEGGFAKFSTPEEGYAALQRQIELDASRGHTLSSFISKYAPPSENDTATYVKQVAKQLGVSPSTKVAQVDLDALARAIALKESGARVG